MQYCSRPVQVLAFKYVIDDPAVNGLGKIVSIFFIMAQCQARKK